MTRRLALARWALAFPLPALSAYAAVTPELRVGPVYGERFPTVQVLIQPPGGRAAGKTPLRPGDLTLLEDGRATVSASAIQPFSATGQGIALVLVVDVSGSMRGSSLGELKRALGAYVGQAGSKDRLALVTFANDVRVDADFDASREDFRRAVANLESRGTLTELHKALFRALELFGRLGLPAWQRLAVISDGKDEGTAYTLDDVIGRARSLDVPVDAIGLTRIDPKYLSALERLADLTGGVYARGGDAEPLDRLMAEAMKRVQSMPVATFNARTLKADGESHRLGVRLRHGDRRLEGETRVVLPLLPEKSLPLAENRRRPLFWIMCSAAALALAMVAAFAATRRRRPSPPTLQRGEHGVRPDDNGTTHRVGAAVAAATSPPDAGETDAPLVAPVPLPEVPRSVRRTQFRVEFRAPLANRPSAVLVGETGPAAGQAVGIETDPFWMGADQSNSFCIADDMSLSGHHACIRFSEGSLLLYDNHSTNGTFLNDQRLTDEARTLSAGDRIRVGRSSLALAHATEDSPGDTQT